MRVRRCARHGCSNEAAEERGHCSNACFKFTLGIDAGTLLSQVSAAREGVIDAAKKFDAACDWPASSILRCDLAMDVLHDAVCALIALEEKP